MSPAAGRFPQGPFARGQRGARKREPDFPREKTRCVRRSAAGWSTDCAAHPATAAPAAGPVHPRLFRPRSRLDRFLTYDCLSSRWERRRPRGAAFLQRVGSPILRFSRGVRMGVQAPGRRGRGGADGPPPEALVERLFKRISEVSSLPAVAIRIIEVANDARTGADDLYEAVQFDAALAMRIMRTVNSSYYALQNKVGDLKLAITLLGFKEIRNLAVTAYIAQLFKKGAGHGTYSREGLWNHLIGVGTVARLIAETSRRVAPREAYLAGLLHDLGLILIDQYLHKPFCQVIDTLDEDTPMCQLEREILGFDHASLGEFVAAQWNLPEHLTTAIRYHHAPLEYQGEHREIVYAVALADFLCNVKQLSPLGVADPRVPPADVFFGLGLDKAEVSSIWERLDEALQAADIMRLVGTA